MKHYIFTNRKVYKDESGKEKIVESGYIPASTEIRFGTIEGENITIDKDIVIPDGLVHADYADPTIQDRGSAKLFNELFEFLKDEDNELIIFIPGYGNALKHIYDFNEKLDKFYVKPSAKKRKLLTFFWTTNGKKGPFPKEYLADASDSVIAGRAFAKLLIRWNLFLKTKSSTDSDLHLKGKMHLMIQSMGNMVFSNALDYMKLIGEDFIESYFSEIVLLGADVHRHIFQEGESFDSLSVLADRIHVFGQKKDKALKLSSIVWGKISPALRKRLGQGWGKSQINPDIDNLFAVDVSKQTRRDFIWHVDELVEHWYFVTCQSVIDDINTILNGGNSCCLKN